MGKVTAALTMSLDGFIAGPNDEVDRLFGWYGAGDTEFVVPVTELAFQISAESAELIGREWGAIGAIVTGRRDFDVSNAWGGEPFMSLPTFIVTHSVPEEWASKDSGFTFVTGGVAQAVNMAREAAGDKDVSIGGSTIVQQALKAGLLDEIHIELAPVLLGEGIRLFDNLAGEIIDLEIIRVIEGSGVTHLRYRVLD